MNHIVSFDSYALTFLLSNEKILSLPSKALVKMTYLDLKYWLADKIMPYAIIFANICLYLFPLVGLYWTMKVYSETSSIKPKDVETLPLIKNNKSIDIVERMFLDPNHLRNLIDKFIQLNIAPIEYNRLINEPFTGMYAFRLIFLDLIRRNIISINRYTVCINIESLYQLKPYEHKFIQILLTHMDFREDDIYRTISLVDFINHLVAQHSQISLASTKLIELLNYSSYNEYIKDEALIKDAKFLKSYFNKQNVIQDIKYNLNFLKTSYDILEHYNKYLAINSIDLYVLASSTPLSLDKITIDHFSVIEQEFIDLKRFYYEVAYILDVSAARNDDDAPSELIIS